MIKLKNLLTEATEKEMWLSYWSDDGGGYLLHTKKNIIQNIENTENEEAETKLMIKKVLSAPVDKKINVEFGYLEWVMKVRVDG